LKLEEVVARTDVGRVREHNEDNYLVNADLGIVAVADGMGGLALGEVAAATAIATLSASAEVLRPLISAVDGDPSSANRIQLAQALEVLSHIASQRIQQATQGQQSGTTMVSAILTRDHLLVCHVGDSRAYLYRDGTLRPITEDHTIAAARHRQGLITKEEHDASPYQHMLYQALGTQGDIDPDLLDLTLADDDLVLLCSDGLTGPVSDDAIGTILAKSTSLDDAADQLIALSLENGGPDNITIVLARVTAPAAGGVIERRSEELAASPTFAMLSEADHLLLALFLEDVGADSGEAFDLDRGVHVLVGGTATSGERTLAPGDAFGVAHFAGAVAGEPDVTAGSSAHAAVLTQHAFDVLDKRRPALSARLLRGLLAVLASQLPGSRNA
jgi:PPM family protein phosphatase